MTRDKKRILICGNYGASNWGDEAILAGLINLVKSAEKNAEIVAMTASPEITRKAHAIGAIWHFPAGFRSFFRYWFSPMGWQSFGKVASADLVLLGGGGLFNDEKPAAIWIWFVQFCWFWILRKKVFCIAQSVGPVKGKLARFLTKFVFKNAAAVTVRDEASKKLLEELGVKNVLALVDPAYAIGYETEHSINRQKRVVLTARNWLNDNSKSNQILAELADWIGQKYGFKTAFIPFQTMHENDVERFNQIARLVKNRSNLELIEAEDYSQAIEMIGRSEMVIGMRLHSIIFAVLTRTPFVAISYSKKVKDFVETLDLAEYCLDYQKLELENLKHTVKKALENRKAIEHQLEKVKLLSTYKFFQHEEIIKKLLE